MTTWEQVHAGDIVLGHDGLEYGVAGIRVSDPRGPVVTLTRYGATLTAQPPAATPIIVLASADVTAEAGAFAVIGAAGLAPELIEETCK